MIDKRQKYLSDNTYRMMIDSMIAMIDQLQLTPSELREMAMLASILYEEKRMDMTHCIIEKQAHLKVVNCLKQAWEWVCPAVKDLNKT